MPTRTKPLLRRSEGEPQIIEAGHCRGERSGYRNSIKWQAHAPDCDTYCTGEPKEITATKVRDDLLSTDSLIVALLCSDTITQVGFRDFHEEESTLVFLSDLKYPVGFLMSNHLLRMMLCRGN